MTKNSAFKTFFSMLFVICFLLPFFATTVMAADGTGTIHVTQSDKSDTTSSSGSSYQTDDGLANKIYSNDTILGFQMGTGKITDVISLKHCMGVISANPIVFAILCVLFAIIIAAGISGFLWSIILHGVRMVVASLDGNADQAVAKMHQHRKTVVYLAISIGIVGLLICGSVFILTFFGA